MSYNSELQANNTDLQDILDTINNLPESGGGGGGSGDVPTCTITISSFAANIRYATYTSYENGEYIYHDESYREDLSNITLNNVVSGGIINVGTSYNAIYVTTDKPVIYVFWNGVSFTLVTSEDTSVYIGDDD
ncbi:MAG: hypothetical protein IKB02_05960 [Clostridia bacterium]|nr:hypothetical protein [Clostridia bacterium]MBR2388297.1 hypothetical protein [Clostridia bacterium]